jgi:hypothetical protein
MPNRTKCILLVQAHETLPEQLGKRKGSSSESEPPQIPLHMAPHPMRCSAICLSVCLSVHLTGRSNMVLRVAPHPLGRSRLRRAARGLLVQQRLQNRLAPLLQPAAPVRTLLQWPPNRGRGGRRLRPAHGLRPDTPDAACLPTTNPIVLS